METGEGVEGELSGSVEKAPEASGFVSNVNKENEVVDGGIDALQSKGALEDPSKVEVLAPSGARDEVSADASRKIVSNLSTNTKAAKERGGRSSETVITQNQRKALSKSFTFGDKVVPKGHLRKSTTLMKQRKTDANGSEVASSATNGTLTAKKTSVAAPPGIRRSAHMKLSSVDVSVNGTSETLPLNDGTENPMGHISVAKIDDDAVSNTSSTTSRASMLRKSTGSVFSFKLDERAEKRKEFFMKLEEKIQAKEVEKSNLQEKSKENQEAEIKQLRRSLTFKATPMPSFYQEPEPAKVELKKIPPTRARSPKLGRHKSSAVGSENPTEVSTLSRSLLPSDPSKLNGGAANNKAEPVTLKKPTSRSLSRMSSQKSSAASKVEVKPSSSKPKASKPKPKVEKAEVAGNDTLIGNSPPETGAAGENSSFENTVEADATINLSDSGVGNNEVLVNS